ncbi:hypothetical protein VNI00_003662 [Paramarasmius palmivorus]|uniref:Uncharacterized protein n=1 Tax=Paramarasmius palmivorus TaxID=297713 RepID=A0AAW0DT18_9AGAR
MLGPNFDVPKAGECLEQLAKARTENNFTMNQLARFAKGLEFRDANTDVHQTGTRECLTWRITSQSAEGNSEETVFTVQGIIVQCDLPPILRGFGKHTTARNIQQRVVITGLDQPTFLSAIEGLNRVNMFLRRHIREDTLPEIHSNAGDHYTIEVTNRYFTSQRFAANETHVPFPESVDPKGHLERLKTATFIHTTENDVSYYERTVSDNGKQKFKEIDPSRFRAGDIVEIQLTLTLAETQSKSNSVRQTKENETKYKTRLVLRGITMLDSRFSEAIRLPAVYAKPHGTSLKRKIGYFAEEELQTQEDLKRMAIDSRQ